jgi:integrase
VIEQMPRPRLPYLRRQITRHGATVWYVRIGQGPRIRIRAPFGTPEFQAEYDAARLGQPIALRRKGASTGTLEWLWGRYQDSMAWAELKPATQRQRQNVMKRIMADNPELPFAEIERKHVRAGIDRRAKTPAAARHFLEAMRSLFKWAVAAELARTDPTQGVDTPRRKSDGHHVWTEEECARYEARWPLGTRERLAFDVLLFTGLRRGDAVRLGRQHVRDGEATIRTEKTGEPVTIPMLAPLLASIEAGPCGDLAFIAGAMGRPMTKEAFGNWFRTACAAAGVPGSAHGLRKAGATRLADAGASEHELMALYGWDSPRTAAIYTRKANRQRLARSGSDKLSKARS